MRANEFIKEESMRKSAVASVPGMRVHPGLDNSSPYAPWRFGIALAGSPDFDMDKEGPTGQKLVTVAYSDADADIIKATEKFMGAKGNDITTAGSKELDSINTVSPVSAWNNKKKKVKEGVMQTGDPGMGTPEANKKGSGVANYVSLPHQSQFETVDDLDEKFTNAVKKIKRKHLSDKAVEESATAGATSSGNVASLGMNPALSPGPARGKKSYTGTPGHSGTKAPPQPKVKQPKTANGTAKNGLDMKGSIFGQPIKR